MLVVTAHACLIGGELEPLRRCMATAVKVARTAVVDCPAIDAADEHGLRLLRDAHTLLGTRLRVVAARGGVVHLALKDAGLAHLLALHATFPAALPAAASRESGRVDRAALPANAADHESGRPRRRSRLDAYISAPPPAMGPNFG